MLCCAAPRMTRDLHQPHDRLFRKVFSEPAEAAGLLRAYVPGWLAETLDWSSLTLMPASYVDDELQASESDLLFAVEQRPWAAESGEERRSLRLYLLFEHQSTPDRMMSFRLLKYCCRIWDDFLRSDEGKERPELPPIVPLVFYQGESSWRHATEFSELFAESVRGWPWTPQFKHLLVDQSETGVEAVPGETLGRAAQLALMAAAGREVRAALAREALARTVRLMGELHRAGQGERIGPVVLYVIGTQDNETLREFDAALRREVPGPGGDMKTYGEQLIQEGRQEGLQEGLQEGVLKGLREGVLKGRQEGLQEGLQEGVLKGLREGVLKGRQEGRVEGRQEGRVEGRVEGRHEGRHEGRQEGRQEGQIATIESFLRAGVGWSTIKQATGIDQEAFELLRGQTHAADRELT